MDPLAARVRNIRLLNVTMVSLFAIFAAAFLIAAQLIADTHVFTSAAPHVMYAMAGVCGLGVIVAAAAGYHIGMLGRGLKAVTTDIDGHR